jgi:hypothetical protein
MTSNFPFQLNGDALPNERKFAAEVRRVDEMERRLELVRRELVKDEIEIQDVDETPRHPTAREINDLEALIERNEQEIMELTENFSHLLDNQRTLVEYRSVLETAEVFFNEGT